MAEGDSSPVLPAKLGQKFFPPFLSALVLRVLTGCAFALLVLGIGPPIPADAVTRPSSGPEPHINLENAALQIPLVARVCRLNREFAQRLAAEHTRGRALVSQ